MNKLIKTLLTAGLFTMGIQSYAATPTNTATNAAADVPAAERAKIEAVVHQYLIRQPEVLVEAMQVLQQRQMEQAQQTLKQTQQSAPTFANVLFKQPSDPVVGNPNGKITIVEFFDYQCPHCVDMAPIMDAILKANPNLRVVYKEFPIRGPLSETASRAALAAHKQGKYHEFYSALMSANQPLTEAIIFQIAKAQGLDVDKLKTDMKDPSIDKQLKDNAKLAQDLKLLGTPAFFIGKSDATGNISYIPGQATQKQLQEIIDSIK